ncbi:molybdotransferase-like divisome protein Glp [Corynebacterium suicordis]|uniref:Molybdopterin molybdenumtransferase n=1 Tax=Corynebacterium suicordis DSM 45110 TaxID=1121369 RepID=A0ABR9ZIA9_9CORY|nr:gephyrin-like molybdotransferase Glp [Corynebacterium suicordis]MBF4553099.1 molybdopterin molybdotransferase MoeA [Corynebacterium suicordis DSM 45110]MDR6277938.1 molybdopterin molybdotransferase [Corynebacterium suicordis]
MRSVEEQLALITAAAVTPEPVRIAISEALGLRCAEQVEGAEPIPGFDQAAIDGFAVRSVDIRQALESSRRQPAAPSDTEEEPPREAQSARPVLPIVGEVTAGSHRPVRLQPRQAVRVHTGAPLPTLADAVVPLDWADVQGRRMEPLELVQPGQFVHRKGSDVQPGDVVVEQGAVIGAAQVGLLAAVGRSKVLVYPRPRLSILSFGPELLDIDREPGLGQVYDVNSYALAAAGREAGAEVHRIGIISGEPRRLQDTIEGQLLRSEIVVISGAVGGESSDRLREVLSELGEMEISRVAMHPGSVLGFGQLGPDKVPTFLLPANPSAALVAFEVMVRPLIQLIRGQRQSGRRIIQARSIASIESAAYRRGFVRGQLMRARDTREFLVDPLGASAGSGEPLHLLGSHGQANCLIIIPADVVHVAPGQVVDVMFLSHRS